jgi:predicted dehydrogenase
MHWELALVVGYGSIGKRHVEQLIQNSHEIWILDNRDLSGEAPSDFKTIKTFDEIQIKNPQQSIAVIANWGPDHLETLVKLANLGFTNLILEKPITTSVENLYGIRDIKFKFGLNILINQGWNYSEFYNQISALQSEFRMGPPVAIWSVGGARCLSTTGSHIVHLASRLFDSKATDYSSSIHFEKLNPRSPLLDYVEGVGSIRYESGARLSLNYTNLSSVEGTTFIYWRNHLAEIDAAGHFKLKSNSDLVSASEKITKYSPALQFLFDSRTEKNGVQIDNMQSTHSRSRNFVNFNLTADFSSHFQSAFDLLMLLNSGVENRTLTSNDTNNIEILKRNFQIS